MQLCFNASAYARYSLEHALSQISSFGYYGVEMRVDRPHAFPDDFDTQRILTTKSLLNDLHLQQ